MNILVPDSWLREYLTTKATPKQIKEYLSLCGPSVERIHTQNGEVIYDVEITTNRPDAMSISGIAREASVILPQFGIAAEFIQNPYNVRPPKYSGSKKLTIKTDHALNPRWTSIVMTNVAVKQSPDWLVKKLESTGIRPINTIVDITNYLMRAYGQPAHAFDYDAIAGHTMKLRASRNGEKLTTLDGKTHTLPGGDIVIEDGKGNLIDLCGIMGAQNSSITDATTTIVLFLQTYEPIHIRKTSMRLAHRTEAASLFEKGIDSELVLPAIARGIKLIGDIAGGVVASPLYDRYPKPFVPYSVSAKRTKIDTYLGTVLPDKIIRSVLTALGFETKLTKTDVTVRVPSWRRDVAIDVDIIEEIARIYGYHRIESRLPEGQLPNVTTDQTLSWEEEIKIRLRDWGYTELYTYSMLSQAQMDAFHLDKTKAYKLANPLSAEWLYMRPSLIPGVVAAIEQNLKHESDIRVFELSKVYRFTPGDLPEEDDMLIVGLSGKKFFEAKGIGEAIVELFGCTPMVRYGSVQIMNDITLLELSVKKLIQEAKPNKKYIPLPRYPPIVEDISFTVPEKFAIGPLIDALKNVHPLIAHISLLDVYENTRTLHISYQDSAKNLTTEEVAPIRTSLIRLAKDQFGLSVKTM